MRARADTLSCRDAQVRSAQHIGPCHGGRSGVAANALTTQQRRPSHRAGLVCTGSRRMDVALRRRKDLTRTVTAHPGLGNLPQFGN